MYAGRVRVLDGGYLLPAAAKLTSFACTYLSGFRRPLIPGLQRVNLTLHKEHDWTLLLLLCSTDLKIVEVFNNEGGDEDGRMMATFLHSLRAYARSETHGLEKLHISIVRHNHMDLITKFDMLQDVQLWFDTGTTGALLVEGFSKLSVLDHLSTLRLYGNVGEERYSLVSPLPPPHSVNFKSLHSIVIHAPSYIALLFVQCLRADTLKCIQLNCVSSPLDQPTTFRRIAEECEFIAPSLKEVDLSFNGDQRIGPKTFDAILNLTRCFHLRTLEFNWSRLEINDAHINRLSVRFLYQSRNSSPRIESARSP